MSSQTLISFCLAVFIITGCTVSKVDYAPEASIDDERIVRSIAYDEHGLPILGESLVERPSRSGAQFIVVRLSNNRPMISYDVAIVRKKPDLSKPFIAVYEWTGKGFRYGAEASTVFAQALRPGTYSAQDAVAALAFVVTPMAAGTVGGFVIGVVDGIRQTTTELGKLIKKGEQVITCTTYHYDSRHRLVLMRMLSPDRKQELVSTEFFYEEANSIPVRTIIKSRVEGTEREIK